MSASEKPRSSITIASRVYMIPIRLWSTLVIHSRQRYGSHPFNVTQARTPMIITPTRAAATSGIGWSNGMAAQLSFPNMFSPPSAATRSDEAGRFAGVVRVDEQPLPIQRDDLDLERRRLRCQWLGGIELMGADPGDAAQKDDGEEGNGPGDELDAAGVLKIRQVDRPRVGGAKPPGEGEGRGDRREHDGEHDGERVDEDRLVGNPDEPLRVEDG